MNTWSQVLREATTTYWKEIRKESPSCWDRSPPGDRDGSVGSVNSVEICDAQSQDWKGVAVLEKEDWSKAIRIKILTKHEPPWKWLLMLAVGGDWMSGKRRKSRKKAARLFLISPTEDMYVRELCRQIWITVVLFDPRKVILWVEFSGCKMAFRYAEYSDQLA